MSLENTHHVHGRQMVIIEDEDGGNISSSNPLPVVSVLGRAVKWITDTNFNAGTPTNTAVVGTGEDATVDLDYVAGGDNDIPYTTEANYTLSDGAKLEVAGGTARLKSVAGDNVDYPFTTPANYTYNASDIDVTGGKAILKDAGITPYAWYHLNASTGTTVTDSSGNGRHGTTQNMENEDWVSAKLNNGLHFDGANEWVNCGAVAGFERTTPFSFEFWMKPDQAHIGLMLSKAGTSPSNPTGWASYVHSDGTIHFWLRNGGFRSEVKTGMVVSAPYTTYYHVVCVNDGTGNASGLSIYVNGVSQSLSTVADNLGSNTILNTGDLEIASRTGGSTSWFDGILDEVVVYDFELSADQVSARYNSGTGTETIFKDYPIDNPNIVNNTGFAFNPALSAFTETSTKSGSDEIKYHVSSDDGSTWEYWDGGAWAVTDNSYTQANTATDINTNISTLAVSGTFKFRALLHSDDGLTTPQLDNVYVSEPIQYSTTDNLYVDTKDASQIAPASINAWLTTTVTETLPANTDIKLMLSNNGRVSWLTWGGSSWDAPADATLRANATTIANAEANFADLPVGSDTLDVRVFLYTSDTSATPLVDNINATSDAGYETSGSFESNEYDSTYLSLDWGIISYLLTVPSGTTATIKARAGNESGSLGAYGSALSNGEETNATGRYIQFKVDYTSDGSDTPSLDWASVFFLVPFSIEISGG